MADLTTSYLGIELKNPIIVGSSELTSNIGRIKLIEESGAGALVIKSLFEEQIQLETFKLEDELTANNELHAEMISIFPKMEHAGAAQHLMWTRKAKESLSIPVFASLNAVNKNTWIDYAKKLEETGVDGLELNFYAVPTNFAKSGGEIEDEQIDVVKNIRNAVSIPIAIKLSSFYTNPVNFISNLDKAGVEGIVIFNQLFQPEIDIETEKNVFPLNLSSEKDSRLPLRYAGLLYKNVNASICASTGIYNGADVAKMLLAGADCVQIVSTLYKNKIEQIASIVKELEEWMDEKGYKTLADFRGKLSRNNSNDPWAYKRAQYVKMLLKERPLD